MGEDATCVWQLWKTSCTLYIFVLCTFMCWYLESLPLQDDCSWPPTVHAALEMWPSTVTSPTWAAKAALLGHLDDQCRCMKNDIVALPGLCFFQTLTYGKWKWMLQPRSWRFSAQKFQKFPQKYATQRKEKCNICTSSFKGVVASEKPILSGEACLFQQRTPLCRYQLALNAGNTFERMMFLFTSA